MDALFASYAREVRHPAPDEVCGPQGVRPLYAGLARTLARLGTEELARRRSALDVLFRDRGVTFSLFGEERPFPLDVVPRVLEAAEWRAVEAGVAQRVRALEAFLADVYGPQQVLRDHVVPRRLVLGSAHFARAAHGWDPPGGVRVHVSGSDLVRGADGALRVLEDNLRVPSGVSYVLENRRAMVRVAPEMFVGHRVRPVADYAERLLSALRAVAPTGVTDPTVAVLTPGVHNSAYFEHTLLARLMGVELVEGRDIAVRGTQVVMRTTAGERPVHVLYRRLDDDYLDPLAFRADSLLGVPGLMTAARAGRVTLANAVGNGVADDKLLYTYVPDLVRYHLGEEPLLGQVDTYRLGEGDQLEQALDRLDELVVKPVDASGGKGVVICADASPAELDAVRATLRAAPREWIAQELVQLSTSPTVVDGRLAPRHVDLRPFAVHDGRDVWVLPGGLTRVALPEGGKVVNSSQGGGSKDTWVLADEPGARRVRTGPPRRRGGATVRGTEAGPHRAAAGAEVHAQQQQQQQRDRPEPGRGPTC